MISIRNIMVTPPYERKKKTAFVFINQKGYYNIYFSRRVSYFNRIIGYKSDFKLEEEVFTPIFKKIEEELNYHFAAHKYHGWVRSVKAHITNKTNVENFDDITYIAYNIFRETNVNQIYTINLMKEGESFDAYVTPYTTVQRLDKR